MNMRDKKELKEYCQYGNKKEKKSTTYIIP